jgi:hypothetical protein
MCVGEGPKPDWDVCQGCVPNPVQRDDIGEEQLHVQGICGGAVGLGSQICGPRLLGIFSGRMGKSVGGGMAELVFIVKAR